MPAKGSLVIQLPSVVYVAEVVVSFSKIHDFDSAGIILFCCRGKVTG